MNFIKRFFLCFQEAINLLEPMTNDPVNYVRQGALIASALIMIQQTEITCPKVSRQKYYLGENWFRLFFRSLSSLEYIFTSDIVNTECIGSKEVEEWESFKYIIFFECIFLYIYGHFVNSAT